MRSIFLIAFSVFLMFVSCKRTEYVTEDPGTFDMQYSIFRVKVMSESGTPYSISIKRENITGGATKTVDNIDVNQNTGVPFDYGFTPNVGEKISVVVKSSKNDIKPYAFYKGKHSFPLELKPASEGYKAEFSYQVEE